MINLEMKEKWMIIGKIFAKSKKKNFWLFFFSSIDQFGAFAEITGAFPDLSNFIDEWTRSEAQNFQNYGQDDGNDQAINSNDNGNSDETMTIWKTQVFFFRYFYNMLA